MVIDLYDAAWSHIIEGLDLRAEWLAECDEIKEAENVRELIKALGQFGTDVMGGKIEGYRLKVDVGYGSARNPRKKLTVEIRVVEENA